MSKRMTKVDRDVLAKLLAKYSLALLIKTAGALSGMRKPGRRKDPECNAVSVWINVEARRIRGNLEPLSVESACSSLADDLASFTTTRQLSHKRLAALYRQGAQSSENNPELADTMKRRLSSYGRRATKVMWGFQFSSGKRRMALWSRPSSIEQEMAGSQL